VLAGLARDTVDGRVFEVVGKTLCDIATTKDVRRVAEVGELRDALVLVGRGFAPGRVCCMIADAVAVLGGLNIVVGELDR
jgi:hypothetical protein